MKRHLKCLNSSLADYDFDHDEIVEKLVALGAGLGFEAESEVPIASGVGLMLFGGLGLETSA